MNKENKHSQRSAAMRERLISACIESLIDVGFAGTTTVEVCARAGVTRGALLHHFCSLPDLLAETLKSIYDGYLSGDNPPNFEAIEAKRGALSDMARLVLTIWSKVGQREFKAVIELWLAARNNSDLRKTLKPVIDEFASTITPANEGKEGVDDNARDAAMFRLAVEAMIGLAFGRAVSIDGKELAHTESVLWMLIDLVDGQD